MNEQKSIYLEQKSVQIHNQSPDNKNKHSCGHIRHYLALFIKYVVASKFLNNALIL